MRLFARQTGLLLVCGALLASAAAQTPSAAPAGAPATALAAAPKPSGSGQWKQLSPQSKAALAPLAERWGELSDTQRSKWLTIAANFGQLSEAEQQVMHSRMREWVALSPAQRNQARLNFNTLQGVSKDQKKSRWDEYQALSDEEKRKLSAGTLQGPAKTTASSARPMTTDRLVQPTVRTVPAAALPPRAPIDPKTLLPVPPSPPDNPPQAAPATAEPGPEAPAS